MTEERMETAEMRNAWSRKAHISLGCCSLALSIYRESDSSGQIVAMMQTAEPGCGFDSVTWTGFLRHTTTSGRPLGQREMRPVLVVVANVFSH